MRNNESKNVRMKMSQTNLDFLFTVGKRLLIAALNQVYSNCFPIIAVILPYVLVNPTLLQVMVFSKNQSEKEIDEMHSNYSK